MITVSVNPSPESGLAPADVVIEAQPDATVADLAGALGEHLSGGRPVLVVPLEDGEPWPARRRLAETGMRTGDVLDVVTVPASWAQRPPRPSRRRAVLRVVAGPDAGVSHAITTATASVGRGPECTVTLTDPLVSRRHAEIVLGTRPVLRDTGSANGTVVDGRPLAGPVELEWGTAVRVGDSAFVLEPPATSDGSTDRTSRTADAAHAAVLRPPRFGEPLATGVLEIPSPPAKPRPQPLQWAMFAMPLVFGGAMLMQTRSTYSLAYIAGYPLVMVATFFGQRRRHRKEHAAALKLWRADVDATLEELDRAAQAQRLRASTDLPDSDVVAARVHLRSPALWTRQEDDPDFLACRVGTGPVPALLKATIRDGGDREALAAARDDVRLRAVLDDLAVPVALGAAPLTAITGPAERVDAVARALLCRVAVDHSPAEVGVAAALGRGRASHESWLRWLPHLTRRPGGAAPVAIGPAAGAALLDALAAETAERGATVCLVDEQAGLPRRLVEAAAASAPARAGRLHLIWLGGARDTVPAATATLIDLTACIPAPDAARAASRPQRPAPRPVAEIALRDRGGVQLLDTVDEVGLDEAWRLARGLTPCTDESAVIPADASLPDVARLPELAPDLADPDDVAGIAARWASSRGLRAQIGVGPGGAGGAGHAGNVVSIDLREDGPHGLVAGTTGSGKSELLQTLICSLALNNPPSRMTFLLVDYKGGAAFRECADLPHTVGYITDLSPALVQRALTSLGAEITTREHLLERYAAKDLAQLERDHPEVAPPSLLICVDEFAALTAEVPDFIDGVVNIAQRGRSLGMHLLLATQRPAGVVTGNVRANTDLRIALRVASADDSVDVIDSPDAARISRRTPGRAWVRRTGHGTAELVQAAWVGARAPLADDARPVRVRPFTATSGPGADPVERAGAAAVRLDPRTDLERLVAAVDAAFTASGMPRPRRPWLPALAPEAVLASGEDGGLAVLTASEQHAVTVGSGQVLVGLRDLPAEQAQDAAVIDLSRSGHLLALGATGSGKTELLRSAAVAVSLSDPVPPSIYAVDYAGGGLAVLDALPTVGAVIGESQPERVTRLVRMLRAAVADRNRLLAARGAADVATLAAAGVPLARIYVLVDNLPALLESLEGGGAALRRHGEMIATILQDGRRVGVHVLATGPRRTGLPGGIAAAFGQRLVLRMPADDDYQMLGVPSGVLTADSPAGRALIGRSEVQLLTTGGAGTPEQAERIAALLATRPDLPAAVAVPGMPSRLPQDALPDPTADELTVAVEADFVSAVSLALAGGPLLIAGRAGTGRSGALAGLAQLARRSSEPPSRIVAVGPTAARLAESAPVDEVLDDPERAAGRLCELLAEPAGAPASGSGEASGWWLLLADDIHLWERAWERGGAERDAVAALAELVEGGPARRIAAVVATDTDDARQRGHVPGAVAAARRGRRGILLSPDLPDGPLLGVSVPSTAAEPLAGPGRGLYCSAGTARVVQVICQGREAAKVEQ